MAETTTVLANFPRRAEIAYWRAQASREIAGTKDGTSRRVLAELLLETVTALEKIDEAINRPELHDFALAVEREAQHQRLRYAPEHDGTKEPQDWYWVVGYLAGKALRSHIDGDYDKAMHHAVTTAAVLNNWHARMREQAAT